MKEAVVWFLLLFLGSAGSGSAEVLPVRWLAPGTLLGVASLAVSPDGRELTTGSSSGIKRWDLRARQMVRTITAPRFGDTIIAVSPDQRRLASVFGASAQGVLEIFLRDWESGEVQFRLMAEARFGLALDFAPDRDVLAFGSEQGLQIWDLKTQALEARVASEQLGDQFGGVYSIASLGQDEFFIAGQGGVARVRARASEKAAVWKSADGFFPGCASAAGGVCAARTTDGVALLDLTSGQVKRVLKTGINSSSPDAIALTVEGDRVAALFRGDGLRVWRVSDGVLLEERSGLDELAFVLSFTPDGRELIAGHGSGVAVWDLNTGGGAQELTQLPSVPRAISTATNGTLAVLTGNGYVGVFSERTGLRTGLHRIGYSGRSLAMMRDGTRFAASDSNRVSRLFRVEDGQPVATLGLPAGSEAEGYRFSADERWLAVWTSQEALYVLDASDWRVRIELRQGAGKFWRDAVFSPDNTRFAAVQWDRSIQILSAPGGDLERTLRMEGEGAESIQFANDGGRLFALGKDGELRTWELAAGDAGLKRSLSVGTFSAVLWLPDDRSVIVSEADQGLSWWRIEDGQLLARYADPEFGYVAYGLGLSGDEQTLLCARLDGTLAGFQFSPRISWRLTGNSVFELEVFGGAGPWQWQRMVLGSGQWKDFGSAGEVYLRTQVTREENVLFRVK